MDYEPFPRSLISALTLTDCSMFSLIRDQIKVTTAECVFLLLLLFPFTLTRGRMKAIFG